MKKIITLLAVAVLTAVLAISSHAETVSGSRILSVTAGDDRVDITAAITEYYADMGEDCELGIFRVENGDLSKLYFPIKTASAANTVTFTLELDISDPAVFQYGYVVGVKTGIKYEAITSVKYIENVSDFSVNNGEYKEASGIKGLQSQLITDAVTLGVKHSTVTAVMSDILTDSEEGTPVEYGGNTYYADSDALADLDSRVRTLSQSGIKVYINLLLRDSTGAYTTPDVTDSYINEYSALVYFLAERYSEESDSYGTCTDFIIGYELNEEKTNNFMGISSLTSYADKIAEWIRQADISVRSAYSEGKIYISLSNLWDDENGEIYVFGGEEFYNAIAAEVDADLGIYMTLYEKEETEGRTYITPSTLSVLTDFVPGKRIILEYGTALSGEAGAKAYLNAYKCAVENGEISALIYHRHVDCDGEDGEYGLYTSSGRLEPFEKKEIYTAFMYCDMENAEAGEYVKNLIGDTIGGIKRTVIKASAADTGKTGTLFDFSESTNGFYPTDNAAVCGLVKENNETFMRIFATHTYTGEYFGVTRSIPLNALTEAKSLSVTLGSSGSNDVTYKIYLVCGTASTEYSESKTADRQTLSFDITEFISCADGETVIMKIWAGNGTGNKDMTLDVYSVGTDTVSYANLLYVGIGITGGIVITGIISVFVFISLCKKDKRECKTEKTEMNENGGSSPVKKNDGEGKTITFSENENGGAE